MIKQVDVEKIFRLSDLMCFAADTHLFVDIGIANRSRDVLYRRSGWSGGEPEEPSRAPFIGPTKFNELVYTVNDAPFAMTPVSGFDLWNLRYMGGVRQRNSIQEECITSGSAWTQECDAMWALALNYALNRIFAFHSVEHVHSSSEEMVAAVNADRERLDGTLDHTSTSDYERYYITVPSNEADHGVYWVVHSHYPAASNKKPTIIWDVVTPMPQIFIHFVGDHLAVRVDDYSGNEGRQGYLEVANRDGMQYAFRSMSKWTEISMD